MAETKSSLPSGKNEQAKQTKVLGGMPPKKDAEQIMKVNEPGRRKAPDSFAPSR